MLTKHSDDVTVRKLQTLKTVKQADLVVWRVLHWFHSGKKFSTTLQLITLTRALKMAFADKKANEIVRNL